MSDTPLTPDADPDDWYAEEGPGTDQPDRPAGRPWKLLIVDDDDQVHTVTHLILGGLIFDHRPIRFLNARSAAEARALLSEHDDIAVVFLDVVMESDDAGLQLARYIREELGNQQIRIILRTGQAGQAPERQVIEQYEINDYKTKSELTADKLHTAAATALRAYSHIHAIETARKGLEKIIRASASLFEKRSLAEFVDGVILQLHSLIPGARGLLLCRAGERAEIEVIAGSGEVAVGGGPALADRLPEPICRKVEQALRDRTTRFFTDDCVIVIRSRSHATSVVYLQGARPLEPVDRQLLEVFCDKVAIGFDNVFLAEQERATQRATVFALGKLAEFKDEVTGDHVRRVGAMASRIAVRLHQAGVYPDLIDQAFIDRIELASVLHDVGKVAIPDAILQKPGQLTAEERADMQRHAAVGGQILLEASAMLDHPTYLSMGAEIARSHHERFDGAGYPNQLAGAAIPLSGRIVAVADIFDALTHQRQYKPAWPIEKAVALIREERGRHFDPAIVDAFLSVVGEYQN